MDHATELSPVHPVERCRELVLGAKRPRLGSSRDKGAEVDRAQVAYVVGQQRLLSTRVGGLVLSQVGDRIVVVGLVDEEHAGLTGLPGAMNDQGPDLAGPKLPR